MLYFFHFSEVIVQFGSFCSSDLLADFLKNKPSKCFIISGLNVYFLLFTVCLLWESKFSSNLNTNNQMKHPTCQNQTNTKIKIQF